MASCFTTYVAALGLLELPTLLLLLWGRSPGEVAPWFDREAPLERRSFACMYAGVLALLLLSRFLSAYRPRHRLLQLHNAFVHAVEVMMFMSLLAMKQSPLSPTCCTLLAIKISGCGLFMRQAFNSFEQRSNKPLRDRKK